MTNRREKKFTTSRSPMSVWSSRAAAVAGAAMPSLRPQRTRRRANTKRAAKAKTAPFASNLNCSPTSDYSVIRMSANRLSSRASPRPVPKLPIIPFTTLEPNLGVVMVGTRREEVSFVVADIPGLIEGAHTGAGLGTQFLRHIERTRLLVHMVDVSDSSGRPDVVKDVEVITGELKSFGAGLENKPTIMVASKIDAANPDKLKKLKAWCTRKKLKLYPISAVTGEGIEKLTFAMAAGVQHNAGEDRTGLGTI